ncbi:RDD family protein [Kibdelosporangium persicum]|uniref:RDD domain-containing protein n=1 Tax=Kibdelosporangium persicum TaxID=2698649 RepID=A0ABX2F146_9PSEU|nr:RDD family protein [Kibdelosporangium persicum]NRN64652.1 RDD domain-containing protein [Kibdelosporangium persicum]
MSSTADVVSVRRRDLRQPTPVGAWSPGRHGARSDPRYPSPTGVRQVLSFVIDLVVHVGVPFAVAYALDTREPGITTTQFLIICAAGFVTMSILDRIFLQWATQATIGKAVTALRVIRDDTGGKPTLGMLVWAWLIGVFGIFASLG